MMYSLEQLSLYPSRQQFLIDGVFKFPRDDDVSTGPVPSSVDLRSLASLVAPDALFGQVLSLTWV